MDRHRSTASAAAAAVAPLRALLLACLFSLCLCSVTAIPSVPVESFSLSDVTENRGDTVLELVAALESSGILSLRDVPAYAETRKRFLEVATECTALSGVAGVQSKTLRDGTTRRTISTKSQLHNPSLAHTTVEKDCPRYLPELRAFSELLNVVALRLARAIDGALKTSPSSHSKREKLEDIVASAQHLDHFHAYSSPRSDTKPAVNGDVDEDQEDTVLSLDLHTDNGIMILMTTPEFYAVRDGHSPTRVSRDKITSGAQASAGLLIQQPRQHHVVQPVLMDDELIVMIGEGYKAWMYSTLDFKAVLHGMQMPQFSPALGQISRSWFGKMILLPRDRHMKNLGLTFEEYSEQATSFVLHGQQKGTAAFSAVACPPDSRPVASDKACALQQYEPLPDARSSRDECMALCNTHNDEECQALCAYVATVPRGGVDCWMLCLPNDRCKSHEIAQCDPSGKQQTVCVASPLV